MPKIQALRVHDFKRVRDVEVEPGGRQLVILGGRNAQGKSSVLDAITTALAGKSTMPDEPIRRGESRGSVQIKLDNGIVIKRTLTQKPNGSIGGTLTITTADGMRPAGGAQTWLNARVGAMTVDPMRFLGQDEKAQAEHLRKVAGIDTREIDLQISDLRDLRRLKGRQVKQLDAVASSVRSWPDAPKEVPAANIVSSTDVLAELAAAEATVKAVDEAVRKRRDADDAVQRGEEAVGSVQREIEALERQLAEAKARHARYSAALVERRQSSIKAVSAHEAALGAVIDTGPIHEKLAGLEQANEAERRRVAAIAEKVRYNEAAAKAKAEAKAAKADYDGYSDKIKAAEGKRKEVLSSAQYPVEGLEISEDGRVLYKGHLLSQASQAERIRVSMAIALAGVGDDGIRVALIRDASLLDSDSVELVAKVAEEMDAQVWLERVGAADDGAIIIEDGGVLG